MTVPMPLFHAAVTGVGDEAFDSPPGPLQYVLYLKKGQKAASLFPIASEPSSSKLSEQETRDEERRWV